MTRRIPILQALRRGTAGFFGAFFLVEAWVRAVRPAFDASLWCLDLRGWPLAVATAFTLLLSLALGRAAVGRLLHAGTRLATCGILGAGAAIALRDGTRYLYLLHAGALHGGFPLPASFVWAAALGMAGWEVADGFRTPPTAGSDDGAARCRPWARHGACLGVALAWVILFPLVQVYGFGSTDYRRPADVAVVFGARVYADGQPSMAVADRVDTAVELFRAGWVPRLLFSGGPGDGAVHETEAMRRRAVSQGVPASAIDLDPAGLNTAATVHNTVEGLRGRRVLVVSEFYHLPRIKLAYAAASVEVWTVPARASHWLRRWFPGGVLREVPAFWSYYLRAMRPLPAGVAGRPS